MQSIGMAKSTTIWVSVKTKELADAFKGKKSYNQHYTELMEMYAKGLIKEPQKPILIERESPPIIVERKPVILEREAPVILEREPRVLERERPVYVEAPARVERCEEPAENVDRKVLMEEIRETVAAAAVNPLLTEQVRAAVRKEIEDQFWLNYPRHCRNCGYPTMSGASEPVPAKKDSIFSMLV